MAKKGKASRRMADKVSKRFKKKRKRSRVSLESCAFCGLLVLGAIHFCFQVSYAPLHTTEDTALSTLKPPHQHHRQQKPHKQAQEGDRAMLRSGNHTTTNTITSGSSNSNSIDEKNSASVAATNATKPPLPIDGWNITGDISYLLHFAVVGFPKCGTSTFMNYFAHQPDSIYIPDHERCALGNNQQAKFLRKQYEHYEPHLKMGLKCPSNLHSDMAQANFDEFLPKTKFIVGIRHPILWLESFYNFRVTNNNIMTNNTAKLIGACGKYQKAVCTMGARFEQYLRKISLHRPVFLYDLDQLKDSDPIRTRTFRNDLQEFLDVATPFSADMEAVKPGKVAESVEKAREIASRHINICDSQHDPIRAVLQANAIKTAAWIEETFIKQDNVKISSPDFFKTVIDKYRRNPCDERVASRQ